MSLLILFILTDWFGLKSNTAASPRFHLESKTIVYLTSSAFGPHHKEQKIACINSDGTIRQIDVKTSESYLGMYNQSFPERCWSPDGKHLFFSTPCRSSLQTYALHIGKGFFSNGKCLSLIFLVLVVLESSQIFKLSVPDSCTGSVLLDVSEDYILISGVSLTRPDQLYVGRLNYENLSDSIEWKCLSRNNELAVTTMLDADVLSFKPEDNMEFDVPYSMSKKFLAAIY